MAFRRRPSSIEMVEPSAPVAERPVEPSAVGGPPGPHDNGHRGGRRQGRVRAFAVGVLVVLTCLCLLVGIVGVWARRNFLDTDRFTGRMDELVDDPAVQEAVSQQLTAQLMLLVRPGDLFEEALPERGQILAVPLSNVVREFVAGRVDTFIASDTFEQLFVGAVRRAHATAVRVLRDEAGPIATSAAFETDDDGQVTLNLVPLVDAVLARISSESPELFGREVDIPDVTLDDVPEEAVARIEQALDVDLDDEDFGRITVYDKSRLEPVQDGLRLFEQAVVAVVVGFVLFGAAALWLSRRRRRTLLQLLAGSAVVLVLLRRVVFRVSEDVGELPKVDVNRDATQAVVDEFLDPLVLATGIMLGVVVAVALLAVLTGPYPWAVSFRCRTASLVRSAVGAAGDRVDDSTAVWVGAHREVVQLGGAAVGLLLLWMLDLSWFGVLVLLLLVGAFELVVMRVASRTHGTLVPPGGNAGA